MPVLNQEQGLWIIREGIRSADSPPLAPNHRPVYEMAEMYSDYILLWNLVDDPTAENFTPTLSHFYRRANSDNDAIWQTIASQFLTPGPFARRRGLDLRHISIYTLPWLCDLCGIPRENTTELPTTQLTSSKAKSTFRDFIRKSTNTESSSSTARR